MLRLAYRVVKLFGGFFRSQNTRPYSFSLYGNMEHLSVIQRAESRLTSVQSSGDDGRVIY